MRDVWWLLLRCICLSLSPPLSHCSDPLPSFFYFFPRSPFALHISFSSLFVCPIPIHSHSHRAATRNHLCISQPSFNFITAHCPLPPLLYMFMFMYVDFFSLLGRIDVCVKKEKKDESDHIGYNQRCRAKVCL
ncbi:hypothetical protein EDD21DRAFT_369482 [Dissophora ornata]|nr:hypothetical protein EDD21DRAFT_369482 [Dissophora ornata]